MCASDSASFFAAIALVDVTGAEPGASSNLQRDDDVTKLIKDLNKLAAGDLEEVRAQTEVLP